MRMRTTCCVLLLAGCAGVLSAQDTPRPRARDIGLAPGVFAPGPLNAITDVAGVSVGHSTLVVGDNVRTGVTVVVPHPGNVFQDKVPGAVFVGNAFGKLAGCGTQDDGSALAEGVEIRLRGGVLPHARVHGGCDEERPAVGQRGLRGENVGEARCGPGPGCPFRSMGVAPWTRPQNAWASQTPRSPPRPR